MQLECIAQSAQVFQLVFVSGLWSCPSSAAACLKDGDEYVNLGEAEAGPQWDKNNLILKYTNGQACPDKKRNRTTIITFKCDPDKVVCDSLCFSLYTHTCMS